MPRLPLLSARSAPPGRAGTAARARLLRLALVLVGIGLSLGAIEVVLRLWTPESLFRSAQRMPWMHDVDWIQDSFVVDPDFGFRPAMGSEAAYSEQGVRRNRYSLAKPPRKTRVLFLGDSVTARGRIIDALRRRYGDERFEWWNAGVESYNTVQEVRHFERFNRSLQADEVVLTFHDNDFGTTPVAFRGPDGRLEVYAPQTPFQDVNPWWFEHSYLYRFWFGRLSPWRTRADRTLEGEVRDSLVALRDMVREDGARLSLIVHPPARPRDEWTPDEVRRHELVLAMAEELGLRCFDPTPALEQAAAAGKTLEESPGDVWHPHEELADAYGQWLFEQGLLAPAVQAAPRDG